MYECPWSSACIFVGPLKASKTSSVAAVTASDGCALSRCDKEVDISKSLGRRRCGRR